MSWTWRWWLFLVLLVGCTIFSMFSRGAMNAANVAKHGPEANWRSNPSGAFVGSALAGATYAAIITAVAGLIF